MKTETLTEIVEDATEELEAWIDRKIEDHPRVTMAIVVAAMVTLVSMCLADILA